MRTLRLVLSVAALAHVTAFEADAKPPAFSKLNLVHAQCDPPGLARPGPCSPNFAFASGTATLRGAKEPAPTCPKTHKREEAKGGDVKLAGVTKGGGSFTGELSATVNLTTTFGSDPNRDCPFAGLQFPDTQSLTGTLECKSGRCKGTLFAIACLPAECADTPIISEFVSLAVMDDAGNPLAVPGTVLVPVRR